MGRFARYSGAWAALILLVGLALVCPAARSEDAGAFEMVAELLGSEDRDMRGLALQQVREGLPGTETTVKLAGLLPKLSGEPAAALAEALGDRKDPAARSLLLQNLNTAKEPALRTAIVRALISFPAYDDVPRLASIAATAVDAERDAARQGLRRIKGNEIVEGFRSALRSANTPARIELLEAMAARKMSELCADVVAQTTNSEASVRIAALRTLRSVATVSNAPVLVECILSASNHRERLEAEKTAGVILRNKGGVATETALVSWKRAARPAQESLIRLLPVIGGTKALEHLQRIYQENEELRSEALLALADWTGAEAAAFLLKAAADPKVPNRQDAVRGVIRMAAGEESQGPNVPLLRAAWPLAQSPDDRRSILGALGQASSKEALSFALEISRGTTLPDESVLTIILIAERLPAEISRTVVNPLRDLLPKVSQEAVRKRAAAFIGAGSKQ